LDIDFKDSSFNPFTTKSQVNNTPTKTYRSEHLTESCLAEETRMEFDENNSQAKLNDDIGNLTLKSECDFEAQNNKIEGSLEPNSLVNELSVRENEFASKNNSSTLNELEKIDTVEECKEFVQTAHLMSTSESPKDKSVPIPAESATNNSKLIHNVTIESFSTPESSPSKQACVDSPQIIVPSKGYNLDMLDDLESNPFNTKSTVNNSPVLKMGLDNKTVALENENTKGCVKEVMSLKDGQGVLSAATSISTNSGAVLADTNNIDTAASKLDITDEESLINAGTNVTSINPEANSKSVESPRIIVPSKGYNLDALDELAANPFETNTDVNNTPAKDSSGSVKEVIGSLEDDKGVSSTSNSISTNSGAALADTHNINTVVSKLDLTNEESQINSGTIATSISLETNNQFVESPQIIVPSKGYNLDALDDLAANPFETKTAVNNTPTKGSSGKSDISEVVENEETYKENSNGYQKAKESGKPAIVETDPLREDASTEPEDKAADKKSMDKESKGPGMNSSDNLVSKKLQVLGETLVEGNTNPQTPPVNIPKPNVESTEAGMDAQDKIPSSPPIAVPKKGYNLDFLDNDSYNPFTTKAAVNNSPTCKTAKVDNSELKVLSPSSVQSNDSFSVKATSLKGAEPLKLDVRKTPENSDDDSDDDLFLSPMKEEPVVTKTPSPAQPKKNANKSASSLVPETDKAETKLLSDENTSHSGVADIAGLAQSKSPVIQPKGYNLDFLNSLDDQMDPFKSKSAVMNSPPQSDSNSDPFKTRSAVANSPIDAISKSNSLSEKVDAAQSPRPNKAKLDLTAKLNENLDDGMETSHDKTIIKAVDSTVHESPCNEETADPKGSCDAFKTPTMLGKHRQLHKVATSSQNDGSLASITSDSPLSLSRKFTSTRDDFGQELSAILGSEAPATPTSACDAPKASAIPEERRQKVRQSMTSIEFDKITDAALELVNKFTPDNRDECKRFTPKRAQGSARSKLPSDDVFVNEDAGQFTDGATFFSNPAELDALEQHGTAADRAQLLRNSLYVKFDPLVYGRPSLAPLIRRNEGNAMDADEDDFMRRKSGLITFSPSPQKHSDQTATQTLLDISVGEDTANTTIVNNTTFMSNAHNNTINHTVSHAPSQAGVCQGCVAAEEEGRNRELAAEAQRLRLLQELEESRRQGAELGVACQGLEERNARHEAALRQMAAIVDGIVERKRQLEAEHEAALKQQRQRYEAELSRVSADYATIETSYFDRVQKLNRMKEIVTAMKGNEDIYKKTIAELQGKLKSKGEHVKTMLATIEEKFLKAEVECEEMRRRHEEEKAKLGMSLKRAEVKLSARESENRELQALLDQFTQQ